MKLRSLIIAAVFVGFAGVAHAQTPPVKNPAAISFTSVDHNNAAVTGYTVEIIRTDNTILTTIQVAKTSTTVVSPGDATTGPTVRVNLNVQPIAFGTYTIRVYTVAGSPPTLSVSSPLSDPWERVAGGPSKPTIQ